ncbi:hypothetical protein Pedsa_1175 [Pseudopedobacter saltans DSM 12145]|uniref:Uncharacterized protein n=1 Tax=Pseudopedobacter saltans (strain ATCC 51119 / DSM 12145 / JCM 21818 / CCUG 39354 / LMG 10337 / NBRC 100064 / NCIMB 13643) TaxID=762903 RepID=F0SCY6_PSESL|nr:hypothetical protein Pedsa_1175 [Pseudopedobacter saltans DSM 12145]
MDQQIQSHSNPIIILKLGSPLFEDLKNIYDSISTVRQKFITNSENLVWQCDS